MWATARSRGVGIDGAVPFFLAPARRQLKIYTTSNWVVLQGQEYSRITTTTAHELGHILGLDHSTAPTVCPRPFRPARCAVRPVRVDEFGDQLDLMGLGEDRLGALQLAVLGLAAVRDAPARPARVAVRPLQDRRPTLLRLRAGAHDWFLESRASVRARISGGRTVGLPSGVATRAFPRATRLRSRATSRRRSACRRGGPDPPAPRACRV